MRVPKLVALSILAVACEPTDLGECNMAAARTVVYDANGLPAYEGQAYLIETCGSGSFCHSADIEPALRFGASHGLEYDLQIASDTREDTDRLGRSQAQTYRTRHAVYDVINAGQMPPPGSENPCANAPGVEGAQLCGFSLGSGYERIPEGETSGTPLPSIRTAEAAAIVRNWLACDAPVIERVADRTEDNLVGATVPAIDRPFADNTWGSIYTGLIGPSCARSLCHDGATRGGDLDLSTRDIAHAELLAPAGGRSCGDGSQVRVVPGDVTASLLVHKLRGRAADDTPVCGERMPNRSPMVSEGRIASIEAWIMAGAPND